METYTLSFAAAQTHTPRHPDRTARRENSGLNFDVTFKEFPSRAAMLKTIQLQDQREKHHTDWKAVRP